MNKIIKGIILIACVIVIIGSVGACETESISGFQCLVQCAISAVIAAAILYNTDNDSEGEIND